MAVTRLLLDGYARRTILSVGVQAQHLHSWRDCLRGCLTDKRLYGRACGSRLGRFVVYRGLLISCALAPTLITIQSVNADPERYFGGYRCTVRCLKHAEGFEWAREQRIRNPSQCAGPSLSHMQGCFAFLRDRMRDSTKDDSGQPIR